MTGGIEHFFSNWNLSRVHWQVHNYEIDVRHFLITVQGNGSKTQLVKFSYLTVATIQSIWTISKLKIIVVGGLNGCMSALVIMVCVVLFKELCKSSILPVQ